MFRVSLVDLHVFYVHVACVNLNYDMRLDSDIL